MSLGFKMSIFLWISLSIVGGLFTVLRAHKEERAYSQVFNWLISPLIIFLGLVFIDRSRKKDYFKRVKSNLFIEKE
jgi:hypothetical protein